MQKSVVAQTVLEDIEIFSFQHTRIFLPLFQIGIDAPLPYLVADGGLCFDIRAFQSNTVFGSCALMMLFTPCPQA